MRSKLAQLLASMKQLSLAKVKVSIAMQVGPHNRFFI